MSHAIADRIPEQAHFDRILEGATEQRVMLLRGSSASGKTHLVRTLKKKAETKRILVHADLKAAPPLGSVLETFNFTLPPNLCPKFKESCTSVKGTAHILVQNATFGDNAVLQAKNLFDSAHITEAKASVLLTELRALDTPILLVFDTFEQATNECKTFVGHLIKLAPLNRNISLLVAGQSIPDAAVEADADHVTLFELQPVGVDHWIQWLGVTAPQLVMDPQFLAYFSKFCQDVQGHPIFINLAVRNRSGLKS